LSAHCLQLLQTYKDVTFSQVSVNTLRQWDSVPDATQKRRHVDSPIIVAGAQRVQPLLQLYHSDDLDRWVGMSQSGGRLIILTVPQFYRLPAYC